jgi:hypothetical protein
LLEYKCPTTLDEPLTQIREATMTKYLVAAMSILGLFYVIELQTTNPPVGNIFTWTLIVLWIGAAIQTAWEARR